MSRLASFVPILLSLSLLAGCAQWPVDGGSSNYPNRLLKITVEFADPINPSYYYFMCFDTDGDRETGPLPIPTGPFWGNGWGTGVISAYVMYHSGQFRVSRPRVLSALVEPSGGILDVGGNPEPPISGSHLVRIDAVALGEATIEGTGMVTGSRNTASQNAGQYTLATDATGAVVAGSVAFTPAEVGGRELTTQEQAILDALNVGGRPRGQLLGIAGLDTGAWASAGSEPDDHRRTHHGHSDGPVLLLLRGERHDEHRRHLRQCGSSRSGACDPGHVVPHRPAQLPGDGGDHHPV